MYNEGTRNTSVPKKTPAFENYLSANIVAYRVADLAGDNKVSDKKKCDDFVALAIATETRNMTDIASLAVVIQGLSISRELSGTGGPG